MAQEKSHLPGTEPLSELGDLADMMSAGIIRYYRGMTLNAERDRLPRWQRDLSSHSAYEKSVAPNRERFRQIIGLVDERLPVQMSPVASFDEPALVGTGTGYRVLAVRWSVLPGVDGEGLLLEPEETPVADVVAVPDCEWTPEMAVGLEPGVPAEAQFARRLAENRVRVLVPLLMDRKSAYSGSPETRMTTIPHREKVWAPAYEMGRHMIGYEVQKILGGVDWFRRSAPSRPVGIFGYAEGGLLAFYAAAADPRINVVGVSGYFQTRDGAVDREPVDRQVWGLLTEFGDAEIATLIAPRPLVIENCRVPTVVIPAKGPMQPHGSPGVITTPHHAGVERELFRLRTFLKGLTPPARIDYVFVREQNPPGQEPTLRAFWQGLGMTKPLAPPNSSPRHLRAAFNPGPRFKRQFDQLIAHTQQLMRESEVTRAKFWTRLDESNAEAFVRSAEWYRNYYHDEIIGRLPELSVPPNPRSRLLYDMPTYRVYDVVLDVYPHVFASGMLLVPKNIPNGERLPVVVCQHGAGGRPEDIADPTIKSRFYIGAAWQLAERGFVTYAPQNPYGGADYERILRLGHPLKKSMWSVIVRQHERTVSWLASQPFVDPERIGFYGLSYGGKTAMRVPPLVKGYCLSICSGDFNEYVWKTNDVTYLDSFASGGGYDQFAFNGANRFNHAELSWLIFPRPFMVERGHLDEGIAPDEWVAYEYARTRRRYVLLGLGDRTEIEYFVGPHVMHGVGAFDFLHKHLRWPNPVTAGVPARR